jgi:hypothetical protein
VQQLVTKLDMTRIRMTTTELCCVGTQKKQGGQIIHGAEALLGGNNADAIQPLGKLAKPRDTRLVISCFDMAPICMNKVICASSSNITPRVAGGRSNSETGGRIT